MELIWLEDFTALAETLNFSRAAEMRHITQPAFSRRIRALEDWVGAPLFDRGSPGVALTAAGEQFRHGADEITRRLRQLQNETREAAGKAAATLRFAATHALSFTFFPQWIRALEAEGPLGAIRLVSDTMEACEQVMLGGQAQFLLCHHHADAPGRFAPGQFLSATVGADRLVAVCAPDKTGAPRWRLDRAGGATPFLAYSAESGLGRIIGAHHARRPLPCALDVVFTSQLAATLQTLARDGRGVAYLPARLAETDLAEGRLALAAPAQDEIAVDICLFRPRPRQSPTAEAFWTLVRAGT